MRTADTDIADRVPAELLLDLWRRYRRSGDRRVRDRLIVIFSPLVHYVVRREAHELPLGCELEDLISSGLEALIRAIDHYDPADGGTLEQFVWARVQAEVRDELERQVEPMRSLAADVLAPVPDRGDADSDPALVSARHEARVRFREAFLQLPQRQRNVAVMRHVEGLTLREIGDLLGVTESRVCQIDTRVRRALRVTLADDEAVLAGAA